MLLLFNTARIMLLLLLVLLLQKGLGNGLQGLVTRGLLQPLSVGHRLHKLLNTNLRAVLSYIRGLRRVLLLLLQYWLIILHRCRVHTLIIRMLLLLGKQLLLESHVMLLLSHRCLL